MAVAEAEGIPALKENPAPPMFTPITIGGIRLANRVVVAPMCQYCAEDGMPVEWHYVHLTSRAMVGAGLVFTEMSCISPQGRITHGCAGIWTDGHEVAWKRTVDFVHQYTPAKMCMQIGHAGRKGSTRVAWEGMDQPLAEGNWPLIAPSAIPFYPYSGAPREMTPDDMARITAEFVAAARMAAAADAPRLSVFGA